MNTRDMFHLTACSDLRRNILLLLNEHEKSLRNLREELKISSTTALHALKELEMSNLTYQTKNKNYGLTNIGRIITPKLLDFSNAAEILKKHERFWLDHDISGIPEHMMDKIGWLKNSTVLEAPPSNIFLVHSSYIEMVAKAKKIKGVSPIFVPELSSIFAELSTKENVDIQLVLTEKVMNKLDKEILEDILIKEYGKINLYTIKDDLKIALTVTDYFVSMGFSNFDGTYDWNKDLICYDKKGIEWGSALFDWYLSKAEKVKK